MIRNAWRRNYWDGCSAELWAQLGIGGCGSSWLGCWWVSCILGAVHLWVHLLHPGSSWIYIQLPGGYLWPLKKSQSSKMLINFRFYLKSRKVSCITEEKVVGAPWFNSAHLPTAENSLCSSIHDPSFTLLWILLSLSFWNFKVCVWITIVSFQMQILLLKVWGGTCDPHF